MAEQNRITGRIHRLLLLLTSAAFLVSAIAPYNRLAWAGQMMPALLLVALLIILYPRFRFTTLVYLLVFLHVLLLLWGAHYTYSRNPLFGFLQEQFGWQRNYFDRLGHFAQGFVPAFLFKEYFLRGGYVKKGRMLSLIVILCCLGVSGAYELSEFALVKLLAVPADWVMGTQGDFFDSHWDMLWALIGASGATFLFGPCHDRQMAKLEKNP